MRINSVAAAFFVVGLGAAVQLGAACSSSSSGGGTGSSSGSSSGGEDATGSSSGTASSSSGSSSGGSSSSGSSSGSASSSGGSSGSSSGGGMNNCQAAPGTYTITITADANNPSYCQTPTDLGSGAMFTCPFDSGLPAICMCSGMTETCSNMNVPCGQGCTFTQNQTLNWTSTGYTGTETLVYADGGMCNYTLTAM